MASPSKSAQHLIGDRVSIDKVKTQKVQGDIQLAEAELHLANQVIALAGSPSTVQFQTYTEAYDKDFEDIRLRVPDLTRLRQAIGYVPRYDLGGIIRDCIEAQKK